MPAQSDELLIDAVRRGDPQAWQQLIDRYEGRLLAFVGGRVPDRATAEDVVQETFIGLLVSLPNFDRRRGLEGYLFSIAAHKLVDRLRREGRRPAAALPESSGGGEDVPARARHASSLLRSAERRQLEEGAVVRVLAEQIAHWRRRGQWPRLKCLELLLVRGWSNKEAAEQLGLSEQTVANFKFEFLERLQEAMRRQGLPEEVFPELYEKP
jgi:RNA polymerase sigma-70 factor (ECF subfamily)